MYEDVNLTHANNPNIIISVLIATLASWSENTIGKSSRNKSFSAGIDTNRSQHKLNGIKKIIHRLCTCRYALLVRERTEKTFGTTTSM